jgi:hypothetical protein
MLRPKLVRVRVLQIRISMWTAGERMSINSSSLFIRMTQVHSVGSWVPFLAAHLLLLPFRHNNKLYTPGANNLTQATTSVKAKMLHNPSAASTSGSMEAAQMASRTMCPTPEVQCIPALACCSYLHSLPYLRSCCDFVPKGLANVDFHRL